jgi:hypothetical protein
MYLLQWDKVWLWHIKRCTCYNEIKFDSDTLRGVLVTWDKVWLWHIKRCTCYNEIKFDSDTLRDVLVTVR